MTNVITLLTIDVYWQLPQIISPSIGRNRQVTNGYTEVQGIDDGLCQSVRNQRNKHTEKK
jgi:hypothetical protein